MTNYTESLLTELTTRVLLQGENQPAWTDALFSQAAKEYADYFMTAGPDDEPPTATDPTYDELLATLWEGVVSWEEAHPNVRLPLEVMDGMEADTLEEFYGLVFTTFHMSLETTLDPDDPRSFFDGGMDTEENILHEPTEEDFAAVEKEVGIKLRRTPPTEEEIAELNRRREPLVQEMMTGDIEAVRAMAQKILRQYPGEALAVNLLVSISESAEEAAGYMAAYGNPPRVSTACTGTEAVLPRDYTLVEQTIMLYEVREGQVPSARKRLERVLRMGMPTNFVASALEGFVGEAVNRELNAGRVLPSTWQPPADDPALPLSSVAIREAWQDFRDEAQEEISANFANIGMEAPLDLPRGGYQIKVTLKGIRPPIWRRLVVPADIPMEDLHYILQIAMGWTNSHLHAFRTNMGTYMPDDEEFGDSYEGMRLNVLMQQPKSKITYEYDFGDGWEHEVLLEKLLPEPPGQVTCLKGKRACPPEDIGGVWGYQRYLELLKTGPQSEEDAEFMDWVGAEFDPEAFDVGEVNRRLG